MRILVTWGSKRGGTEGIGLMLGDALRWEGLDVSAVPAAKVHSIAGFDAVIVGGALYANRWHRAARRFVSRHEMTLREVPVWFFSSGPLDDSAAQRAIPPITEVELLMERVGSREHVTFGGRLAADAGGFPASLMAKKRAGDWRQPDRIRAWATAIASALPSARPGVVTPQKGRSVARLVTYALIGWALCTAALAALLALTSLNASLALRALVVPVVFALVAKRYFRARGARDSVRTALTFTAIAALLDLVLVAGMAHHDLAMFGNVLGFWSPLALIFLVTWVSGAWRYQRPPVKAARERISSSPTPKRA